MRTIPKSTRNRSASGVTLLETLVCIAIVAIIGAVLLPKLSRSITTQRRLACISNLKNLGLGFRTFALDHAGAYPWRVAVSNGGFELPAVGTVPAAMNSVFFAFASISNETSTPRILRCPADRERRLTIHSFQDGPSFGALAATQPSYFVGTDVTGEEYSSILSGDRNLLVKAAGLDGITAANYNQITTIRASDVRSGLPSNIEWGSSMHNHCGNLLDGSGGVGQLTSSRVRESFEDAFKAKSNDFHLFFPALEN